MKFSDAVTLDESRLLSINVSIDDEQVMSTIEQKEWLSEVIDLDAAYRVSDVSSNLFVNSKSVDVDDFAIVSIEFGVTFNFDMIVVGRSNHAAGTLEVMPATLNVPIDLSTEELAKGMSQAIIVDSANIKLSFAGSDEVRCVSFDSKEISKLFNQLAKIRIDIVS